MVDSESQYDSKEVGLRVKETAKQQGYTVQTLAEKMNVAYDTVSRIYRGKSLSNEYICDLSKILGVSTDYLLLGIENDVINEEDSDRTSYLKFLSGLSDKDLARAVMHAKVDLGMI